MLTKTEIETRTKSSHMRKAMNLMRHKMRNVCADVMRNVCVGASVTRCVTSCVTHNTLQLQRNKTDQRMRNAATHEMRYALYILYSRFLKLNPYINVAYVLSPSTWLREKKVIAL